MSISSPLRRTRPPRSGRQGASSTSVPLFADGFHALAIGQRERGVELGDDIVREAERPVEVDVDPGRADDLLAVDPLGLASEQARAADAVAADVHQRTAVEVGRQPHVADLGQREAERRADVVEPSDRAVLDERLGHRGLRVVTPHERLHHDHAGALGGVPGLLDLGGAARVGLLDQDVLARLDRLERPLVVHPVRQRDVDRVDPVVREQRLVAAVRPPDPVLGRVGLGTAQRLGSRRPRSRPRAGGAASSASLIAAVESSPSFIGSPVPRPPEPAARVRRRRCRAAR